MDVESPVIPAIRIIRLLVVFVLIDPKVVVHIDAKQKLGPIDVKPQKSLLVVRLGIRAHKRIVLVEVGHEVVVLIPARKDLLIAAEKVKAHVVREFVLIVVVIDQIDQAALVVVVEIPSARGDKGLGIVARVHAVKFAEGKVRGGLFRHVDHPSRCRPPAANPRKRLVGFREHVGVLPIAPTQIVLAVHVKAPQVLQLDTAAKDVGRRGQAVLKADGLQIGDVLHIALGLRDEQQNLLAVEVDLAVRGHPDLIVVAQRQQEFDLGDFVLGKTGPIDKIRAIEIVHQPHLFRPVGGDKALLQEAALDDRLKANGLARVLRAIAIGDLHVRRIGKKRRAAHAVFGRVVAQHELDERDGFVLSDGQRASEWVASLLVEQGMRLVGVGRVQRNFGKVAELGTQSPARQDGVIRPQHLAVSGRAAAGVAQPRK